MSAGLCFKLRSQSYAWRVDQNSSIIRGLSVRSALASIEDFLTAIHDRREKATCRQGVQTPVVQGSMGSPSQSLLSFGSTLTWDTFPTSLSSTAQIYFFDQHVPSFKEYADKRAIGTQGSETAVAGQCMSQCFCHAGALTDHPPET